MNTQGRIAWAAQAWISPGIGLFLGQAGNNRCHRHMAMQLEQLAHLSPSRFSHWFKTCSGLSLRSYHKWHRLIRVLQAVSGAVNPYRAWPWNSPVKTTILLLLLPIGRTL